jgi:hypothetical protein
VSDKEKVNRLQVSVGVLVVLLVASGAIIYIQQIQQDSASTRLGELEDKTSRLESILSDVQRMVKTYDLEASFIADEGIALPGDSITFLSGYLQLYGIANIPPSQLKISVYYTLTDSTNSTTGTISYDYDTYREVTLDTGEYKQVMIPWGAFPLKLSGFKQGETVLLNLDARIAITSDYLPSGTYVAEATANHKYRLVIQK